MVQIDEVIEEVAMSPAEVLKTEGNVYFKNGEFQNAVDKYTGAIEECPLSDIRLLSVLFTNRAVALTHINDLAGALEDCHAAVETDPSYAKAYLRRSTVYEKQKNYHDALADMKKACELDETIAKAQKRDLTRLEKLSTEQFEKEKDEVVGKMKDLGNFVLGKFGLSLNNFKLDQNPDNGSYSIQFQQNQPENGTPSTGNSTN